MTVLPKNTYHEPAYLQQNRLFSAHRRYDGTRPVQHQTGRFVFSGSFNRSILRFTVLLALVLFFIILLFDLLTLYSGGANIGELSARIESLNSSNTLLQEDLNLAMSHPVLKSVNAQDGEEETIITLTAAIP